MSLHLTTNPCPSRPACYLLDQGEVFVPTLLARPANLIFIFVQNFLVYNCFVSTYLIYHPVNDITLTYLPNPNLCNVGGQLNAHIEALASSFVDRQSIQREVDPCEVHLATSCSNCSSNIWISCLLTTVTYPITCLLLDVWLPLWLPLQLNLCSCPLLSTLCIVQIVPIFPSLNIVH